MAWEGAWSSKSGSCFKHSVFYVMRSDGSKGTFLPSPPLIPCHLENWVGHPGCSAPVLTENSLSPALPLMLLYAILLAAGVLRTAFPHQRSGKILTPGVGLGGGEERLLCLLWLLLAPTEGRREHGPAQFPRGQHGTLGPRPQSDIEGSSTWPFLIILIFLEAF